MRRLRRSWLWRVPVTQEVDDELAFHVEMRTRELVESGMTPDAARRAATDRMGDLDALRRTCITLGKKRERDMRWTQWIDELRLDLRIALRQLYRAPTFTAVAVATLALGIGANCAIFALVDATLLRPLPFPDADRLVMLAERTETATHQRVSPLNMFDWSERSHTFEQIAGFIGNVGGMVMEGADGTADTVPRQWVTAGLFDVLGVQAIAGRTFTAEDDRQQRNAVVVSEAFWEARFGRDPAVVGRDIRLDGDLYTVVGVVPRIFQVRGHSSIWALLSFERAPELRRAHFLYAVGRMKPGVSLDAARSDLDAVASALAQEFPDTNQGRGVTLDPLHTALIGSELRRTSMLFLGAVGIVLLICCANVANLLLARATVRTRELAIRSALGAGRRRVIRQLITESLVLAAIGGTLGLAIGAAMLAVAPDLLPPGLLPSAVTLTFDRRIAAFCALATLAVGVLFGVAPAWQATGLSSAPTANSDSRTTTGTGGRLRGLLVAGEVATAVLLLFGAGLLLRTLIAVETVDRGYRADSVLTMLVDPLGDRYPTPQSLLQFYDELEQEISAAPGVRDVAWSTTLPLGPADQGPRAFEVVGGPSPDPQQQPLADYQIVSPEYFGAVDLPIVSGRGFTAQDTLDSTPVCMVSEAFARAHLGGSLPPGQRLALRPANNPDAEPVYREVVGIARQVKGRPDEDQEPLQVYVPLAQDPVDDIYLVVAPRSGPAEALAGSVRAAIGRVDKERLVSVRDIRTLDNVAWNATSRYRFRALLVITFAGLALVLAMVGVFGILAYSVQQRVRDYAVRRALGAATGDVVRLVILAAARVVAAGAVAGLLLAIALGRLLTAMLFGVQPLDPLTFAAVTLLVGVTAVLSLVGPALRAARIDPAQMLRGT
jgi:putative ABC transport system permease protein